jgi:microsomal dipeptidase-like Zn-dependent dipeptidase
LSHFAEMGVQMITLCHNGTNEICDSSRDSVRHEGLSPFGREVVKEMNRLGMMIDVSHTSKATTLQVAALSKDPVMASHSGVYALHATVRNVSDEEILAIAAKGGLIQVSIGGFFLSPLPSAEVTVKHLVDHIDYVVNLVGVEHVGIGSDFDGGGGVTDCNSMAEMKNITVELLRRGYTHEQIGMIWGGNVMRMMVQIQENRRLMAVADSLHRTFISIDTHNDAANRINNPNPAPNPNRPSSFMRRAQVTFPLMKQGALDAAFFASYIGQGPRTPEGHQRAFEVVDSYIKGLKEYVQANNQEAAVAYNTDDMRRIKKEGKSMVALSIENGYCVGIDLEKIAYFSSLGVQMMTLCHSRNNEICDSANDTLQYGGLSPFGREVVKEMNRIGMMIDVSHASKASTLEIAALSADPIMASHSGAYALHNNPRNLSDEEILAIAAKGGLVQVVFLSSYLTELPRTEATVKNIVDHIDHVVRIAGVAHVGIGTDFEGGGGVSDCNDVGEMKNVTVELLRRGYTHDQIAMIWGGNVMRMMDRVQKKL